MSLPKPAHTPVSPSKSAALSRVLDLVTKGYTWYTGGQCTAGKAVRLARKFHQLYGIGCSPAQRLTRKTKGLANSALVLFWPGYPDAALASTVDSISSTSLDARDHTPQAPGQEKKVEWLLLVSPGTGPVTELEALKEAADSPRLCWLGYELIRLPKRGKASWTWRRPKTEMRELYCLLGDQLKRQHSGAVADTLTRIANQPGFAGVRQQSFELSQFAKSRGYPEETPFLYCMQKISHGILIRI